MAPTRYIIIGIDPGSGASSPTGFSAFFSDTLEILYAGNITTPKRDLKDRIKHISDVFEATLLEIRKEFPTVPIICFIESFVMRGKGGETLQRLIGSLMGRIPYDVPLFHVQNTRIKLAMAGHGHADKQSVGAGLLQKFLTNPDSHGLIEKLLAKGEADIIDSLAIGLTGWQNEPKAPKRR